MTKSIKKTFLALSLVAASCFSSAPEAMAGDKDTVSKPVSKPLIAINMEVAGDKPVNYEISAPYTKAIIKAGGIPLLIPPMGEKELKQVLDTVDGLMMIGGLDYPPSLYGKKDHKSIVKMHRERTTFDQLLVKEAMKNEKLPFLGICAGAQVLNIHKGGSLTRDIPSKFDKSKLKHASPDGWQNGFNFHKVKLDKDSAIAKIYKKTDLSVPSSHHQCVDKVGSDLKVVGKAPDGVVESIEGKNSGRFVVGVQWHPERDYKNNSVLFERFINSCKSYKLASRSK